MKDIKRKKGFDDDEPREDRDEWDRLSKAEKRRIREKKYEQVD